MIRTRIIGTGSYVPPDILTNDNLSEMVDTSDEWIRTRTGICNRHIAKDMDNADMAYNAARNAVEDARIEASKIGLIIVATSTPDYAFPNQASLVQAKLKAVNAMCFDVSAACSGFITALDIAASMLKAGSYKYALVIGSEKMSEIVSLSKADYIKTSTGFSTEGATFHSVKLFADNVFNNTKIKAAGGISSLEDAEKFIELGADRLGTSRIVKIAKEKEENQ